MFLLFFLIFKSQWVHYPLVEAQKVINYRAPLYTIVFVSILVLIIQSLKKSLDPFLPKLRKSDILAQIFPFWGQNWGGGFFKNQFRTLLSISGFKTSCQISRKSLVPFPGKTRYRQTHTQTNKSDFIGPFPVNRRPNKYTE